MKQTVIIVALLLLWPSPVLAQKTTGGIVGTVTSRDGQALSGVTVAVENPDTGLRRTAVTDDDGGYRLVVLPPGSYEFAATLGGFRPYRRSIAVSMSITARRNVVLELDAFEGRVEVTGEAPLVDVTASVAGLVIDTDELNSMIPVGREVTRIALLAPATVHGDAAFSSSKYVNRGYTPGQNPISIGGASVAETSYQVNGLNTTNFYNGIGSSMVPFEFLEQVEVKTGGYEAEFGRSTGGVINMLTKSGTNSLRGAASLYYQPERLQGQEPNTYRAYNEAGDFERFEANLSLGGTIVRDRLFFFVFGSWVDEDQNSVSTTRGERWQQADPYWGGKVDWNITASHRIEGTYISDEVEVDQTITAFDRETGRFGEVIGTGTFSRGGPSSILRYTGILNDSFLLSAQVGSNDFDRTNRSPNDVCPRVWDSRGGVWDPLGCWVSNYIGARSDERNAYRLDADAFVGHHSLRAGLDVEANVSLSEWRYSGGIYYSYFLNGPGYPNFPEDQELVRVRNYQEGGTYDVDSRSAYVQDSWSVSPHVTLNLGLRYEEYENKNALGETFIEITGQWAPRLGVVWDPQGNGRSKVFASYGLYHLPVASRINIGWGSPQYWDETWYAFDGQLDPVTAAPVALGDLVQDTFIWLDGEVPDPRLSRDAHLDPMSQVEFIAGYERMVGDEWSLGARFVYRDFNEIIEDISIDKAMWETYGVECFSPDLLAAGNYLEYCGLDYRLANPGTAFSGWYDLNSDGELDPIELTAAALGYPEPERKYLGLELTARRRFADRWMLLGSYTWSHSYGNYEGWVSSDIGQDDAGATQTWDIAALMDHSRGDLPNDRRHNLKVSASYAWDSGIQLGGLLWYRDGRPINGFGVHPTDPWAQEYGSFAFYNNGEPCPRGCGGRSSDVWSLDLMGKFTWRLGGTEWTVRLDVFNVFDNSQEAQVREFAELETGAPDPNYLEPIFYQTPRRVRLGIGLSF